MPTTTPHDLGHGALAVQPAAPLYPPLNPGTHWLDTPARPALMYVPDPLPYRPAPLLVAFHGAAGTPQDMLNLLRPAAEQHGALLLAPHSTRTTWDAIADGRFGPDTTNLQHAMKTAFDHFHIDSDRIAVAGFSDGASYALALGLANGDLFTRVLAYSPGHIPEAVRAGRPTVFISHGLQDTVLPITRASRRIVPALEKDGYNVDYVEHGQGHTVPYSALTDSSELLS